ncbi:sugar ABC transporter substrate-binding protein [Arthrobacter sp. K5]|uniref:Sugar ABC transporter substrate-binding protein n=1 Tax=Arthrobacter sp. K5 TaxID=2839623 RepID=A0AAU8EWR6_9MICC
MALSVVSALSACGSPSGSSNSASDTTPKIAYFMGSRSNSYMSASLDGIEEVAKKYGGTVTAFDGKFDPATQQAQIQDALASGKFNAFIVGAVNNTALVPVTEDAISQGIKVASNGFPLGPDISTNKAQLDGQVMSAVGSSTRYGELIGTATTEACASKNPCKVVYMSGDPKVAFEKIKFESFEKAIAGHKNVQVVTRVQSEYLADPARQVMQDVLQSHPDIDVVASNGDQMADGSAQAGTAAGAHFVVIGQGASEIAYKGVMSGKWYASAIGLPKDEGVLTAEAVAKALKGEKVSPDFADPAAVAGYTEGLLTKDFIKQHPDFKPQWSG